VFGWKLPHSDLLACPAVCHASKDYWAVNNKMVRLIMVDDFEAAG